MGEHAGDVVCPPGLVGGFDQAIDDDVGLGRAVRDLENLIVVDHAVKPVGTQ